MIDMVKHANQILGQVAGGDEMKTGADVIPDKNLNERLNELEDLLNEAVLTARDRYLEAGNVYLKAQDMHTAFLLLRNERDELKEKP